MAIELTEIDELPAPARGGKRKPGPDSLAIQEKLLTFKPYQIDTQVEKVSAMQQRIRSAAQRVGVDVEIRNDNGVIKFRGVKKEATKNAKASK